MYASIKIKKNASMSIKLHLITLFRVMNVCVYVCVCVFADMDVCAHI